MFVNQITSAIEGARSDAALVTLNQTIWQGLAVGALNDDDAQRLADSIHARRMALRGPQAAPGARPTPGDIYPPRKPQRPPVRSVAIERRRLLAASGPLPPQLAARFTTSHLAVLRIVGDEYREKGACLLPLDAIAARAGVCRSTVRNALREARVLGLITVEERRRPGQVSKTNVIRVVSREWGTWLVRGPKPGGVGVKKIAPSDTRISLQQAGRAEMDKRNLKRWRSGVRSRFTRGPGTP